MSKWNKSKKKLPYNGQKCLFIFDDEVFIGYFKITQVNTYDGLDYCNCFWVKEYGIEGSDEPFSNVDYWKPLPRLPKKVLNSLSYQLSTKIYDCVIIECK